MNLPINWFDIAVVALLILGVVRGRKLGMSGELLPLLQWASIVVVGAYAHALVGQLLKAHVPLSLGTCKVVAYIGMALIIAGFTAALRTRMGEKLVSKDIFGKGEYYLGMMAGVVHHGLIILATLALLNSVSYSQAQIEASKKRAEENLGSDFFGWAHPARIQRAALNDSIIGAQVRTYVPHLLVSPARTTQVASTETIGQRTSRELNEIMGQK